MDIQQIRDVVNLIANSQVEEVEIKAHGERIRVKNGTRYNAQPSVSDTTETLLPELENTAMSPAFDSLAPAQAMTVNAKHIGKLKLAADAISEPLVNVGDTIKVNDTIAYVASMAQMLPVVSDKAGVVAQILLEEGAKVEYGTPIIALQ